MVMGFVGLILLLRALDGLVYLDIEVSVNLVFCGFVLGICCAFLFCWL